MSWTQGRRVRPVPHDDVTIDDGFWNQWIEAVRETALQYQYERLEESGCLDNFRRVVGQADGEFENMWFADSDAYKWIEAASYVLATTDDPGLRKRLDGVVSLLERAQGEDGYLDTWIQLEYPDRRWTNLSMGHELYCAGHLIEAAVAHHRATGEGTLLTVARGVADLIDDTFGPDGRDGTPGHEEIELALVRLARVTGEERYLQLAQFFVDRRGRGVLEAEFDDTEERAGEEGLWDGARSVLFEDGEYDGRYAQDHAPVVEQTAAEGHSVRAVYLYAGVAALVLETGDREAFGALERIWANVTSKRTYVTGGLGSTHEGERFTRDYHLPNETSYAETCAAIGSVFWNHRMFQLSGESRFHDLIERTLYNAFLVGFSPDVTAFFYANALEVGPDGHALRGVDPERFTGERQDWFECACCPPNAARLLASLGGYVYGRSVDAVYVNQFVGSEATLAVNGTDVTLRQETAYPWDGDVTLTTDVDAPVAFALRVRVPEWCESVTANVNGATVATDADDEYLAVDREWTTGDDLSVTFAVTPERIVAHPAVREDAGTVALRRGPVVYCLEEVDHERPLHHYAIPEDGAIEAVHRPGLLGGVTTLEGEALVPRTDDWEDDLYRHAGEVGRTDASFTAVPYYAWANREPGEMRIWLESA